MSSVSAQHARVLSGMRPTGRSHLGHYHGVLKNWLELQHEYECFFFVADWHALTTHYDDPTSIPDSIREMVIDWLAAGFNPGSATIFRPVARSRTRRAAFAAVHDDAAGLAGAGAKLQRSTGTAERASDLATYGFLGYPLLQSADILDLQSRASAGG